MGTKNNPGEFDCYANADPDEPMFILLGRDRHAPALVEMWAAMRESEGELPAKVAEARACAQSMKHWQVDLEQEKFVQKEIADGSRCANCRSKREAFGGPCKSPDCVVGKCYFGRNCPGCKVCQ